MKCPRCPSRDAKRIRLRNGSVQIRTVMCEPCGRALLERAVSNTLTEEDAALFEAMPACGKCRGPGVPRRFETTTKLITVVLCDGCAEEIAKVAGIDLNSREALGVESIVTRRGST